MTPTRLYERTNLWPARPPAKVALSVGFRWNRRCPAARPHLGTGHHPGVCGGALRVRDHPDIVHSDLALRACQLTQMRMGAVAEHGAAPRRGRTAPGWTAGPALRVSQPRTGPGSIETAAPARKAPGMAAMNSAVGSPTRPIADAPSSQIRAATFSARA